MIYSGSLDNAILERELKDTKDELEFYKKQYRSKSAKGSKKIDLLIKDIQTKFNHYLESIKQKVVAVDRNINLAQCFSTKESEAIDFPKTVEYCEIEIKPFYIRFIKGEKYD